MDIIELNHTELIMKAFSRPWFIAGGWTIDLELNQVTRSHKDMDICIFREDVEYAIGYFKDWDIQVAVPGENRLVPFQNIEDIEPPRYCIHMFKGTDFLELLLTDKEEDEVIFRKDREIRMKINDFRRGSAQRPYVNPVWQLLFKSLNTREEDEHDFKTYMKQIGTPKSMKWLQENMVKANGNPKWIKELSKYFEEGGDISL